MASEAETGVEEERVVLVDENDRALGSAGKLAAHRDGGRLHRAFSVFLFDEAGRMLLQRRAAAKYHFPGYWTNACCGHPRPGEALLDAARRRVREELGVDVELRPLFAFVYEARDAASGLTEREYDHVLVGRLATEPTPAPEEIESLAWWEPAALQRDVDANPRAYTPWFVEALPRVVESGLPGRATTSCA